MYLIELIVKCFLKKRNKNGYDPLETNEKNTDYETCEHVYMPLDSSGEYLACTKCGDVISKKELNEH